MLTTSVKDPEMTIQASQITLPLQNYLEGATSPNACAMAKSLCMGLGESVRGAGRCTIVASGVRKSELWSLLIPNYS